MSDVQKLALVAISSEDSNATRNFDAVIEIMNDPLNLSFDAAVAVKSADGAVSIVREGCTAPRPASTWAALISLPAGPAV